MRYFKDENGKVRAVEEAQEFLIKDDWGEMTIEEIDAHINPPKTKEQRRLELQWQRDQALQSMTHIVAGVGEIQVRPQDYLNFTTRIAAGQDREWVLADNTTNILTVEQMQECLDSGITQGAQIWDYYISALKELNS